MKSGGRSRYYTGGAAGDTDAGLTNVRCYNCDERGHLSRDCTRPKKPVSCYLCGQQGHGFRNCPSELCWNCNRPGHRSQICREPRVKRFERCPRCSMTGHTASACTDTWRQYHNVTQTKHLYQSQSPGVSDVKQRCQQG